MSWKYFLVNNLNLKIDYKIFYFNQFFNKIFLQETNIENIFRKYFMEINIKKYEKYFLEKYFLWNKQILNDNSKEN
jgi:hypothetical protein